MMSPMFAMADEGVVFIEFNPYTEFYVNVDGIAYYATASSVAMPGISSGSHVVTLKSKSNPDEQYAFDIDVVRFPAYFTLIRTIEGLELIEKDLDKQKEVIDDIFIQADSMNYEVENYDSDCSYYTDVESDVYVKKYIRAQQKVKFLRAVYREKCVTRKQLKKYLESALTAKERFETLEVLHTKVTGDFRLRDVESYFKGSDYYRDYLQLLKKNGQ